MKTDGKKSSTDVFLSIVSTSTAAYVMGTQRYSIGAGFSLVACKHWRRARIHWQAGRCVCFWRQHTLIPALRVEVPACRARGATRCFPQHVASFSRCKDPQKFQSNVKCTVMCQARLRSVVIGVLHFARQVLVAIFRAPRSPADFSWQLAPHFCNSLFGLHSLLCSTRFFANGFA